MKTSFVTALLSLAGWAWAASSVILEETTEIPEGWSFQGNASASDKITLFIALRQPRIEQLKASLHQRRNPTHPSFGKHWSRDEVLQARRPNRSTARAVSNWLRSSGVRNIHEQGGLISFEATAQLVKSLFEADLGYYVFEEDQDRHLRAISYKVPASLRDYIEFVHPLTNFMPPRSARYNSRQKNGPKHRKLKCSDVKTSSTTVLPKTTAKTTMITSATPTTTKTTTTSTSTSSSTSPSTSTSSSTLASTSTSTSSSAVASPTKELTPEEFFGVLPCFAATVPSCIKKLYNITYTPPSRTSPVRFGVAGFLDQWIMHADVSRFLRDTMPLIPRNYNFTIELINNGTNPQDSPFNAGLEASLDVQYAMGLGYPAQVIYYSTGGRGTELDPMTGTPFPPELSDNEPYLEFLEALLAKPDEELPHVLSISYADDEPGVPRAYAERVCDMFAALTARGVTVLAATGDAGAAGQGQTRCWSHELNAKRFISTFPASCPYVTAVGATDNIGPPVTGAVYSAGGFSDFFARPEWQEEVVKPYVDRLLQNYTIDRAWAHRMNMFNHNGRATPDISAIGSAFQIALAGDYAQVLGTSASTPVVAAMVALVNDARMRAGKPSLGWLNPILYQERVRRVLRDVTEGISAGCWFPDGKLEMVGWQAGPGYDTVTGLGTVNDFWQFLQVLMEY